MRPLAFSNRLKLGQTLSLATLTLTIGLLTAACQDSAPSSSQGTTSTNSTAPKSLKIGSLLPSTGDLASVGQQMVAAVPMLVENVNQCGGVNGEPVTLVSVDDQTDPAAGAEAMTRLAEREKVAGVVGSFASSVSTAALPIAVRNKVVMISPGSTSPVFTQQAKEGKFQGEKTLTIKEQAAMWILMLREMSLGAMMFGRLSQMAS